MSGKRDFRLSPRTSEIVYGNPKGEEEEASDDDDDDDESAAGDAPERRLDFRQFGETRSPRKKPWSEEDDGATSSARGGGQSGQLHLEKYAQEGGVRPTLSTYASVHPGDATPARRASRGDN